MPDNTNATPLALVADDDELMRSLIAASLTEKGFSTVEASNGREAVTMLSRVAPDLVILDVDMPVMDGFVACQQMRAMREGSNVPIVIVTGTEDTESVERAFELGATDFISKPVNWTLLGHRMLYVLRAAQTRATLSEREAENRALLEALPDRLVLVEAGGQVLKLIEGNTEAPQTLSTIAHINDLLPTETEHLATRALALCLTTRAEQTFEFTQSDTEQRHFEVRLLPQAGDAALVIIRDVSERKRAEAQIHQLAYYDALTGLPNRHLLLERIIPVLEARRQDDGYAALFLGFDRFKRINDTLGHGAGDGALQQIGERLAHLRHTLQSRGQLAEIARFGGDEFVVFTKAGSEANLQALAAELNTNLTTPVTCDRHQVVLTPSIGIARCPEHGRDAHKLLHHAAQAMSTAKASGGNTCHVYSALQSDAEKDLLTLEIDLRKAIANHELFLHFQPKYELQTSRLIGAEALLRWEHPARGLISPAMFIPAAEQSGLIVDIDRWVVDHVCAQLRVWLDQGLACVPVSVNLSGREFCFDEPVVTLHQALARNQVAPELLEVEVTETVLMEDAEAAVATLRRFRDMGIRLSIDDFGTGYSSMSYLQRFPLDTVKIDRSFVRDLDSSESDRALCRAMVSMAQGLGMDVIAEGIETESQRDLLLAMGCRFGQGFLLDRPMPRPDFEERLMAAAATVLPASRAKQNAGQSLRH